MESVIFNMDEVVSRKDYLRNKEKEKRKNDSNRKKKPPYFLIAFIVILTGYVIFQFATYQRKYRLINTVPDEIASLKDYDIYYTTSTYTYNPEIVLNYTKSNDSNKEVVSSAKGITNITGKRGYVYGIKDGKLVRVKNDSDKSNKNNSAFSKLEVVIDSGVKAYAVYEDEIYAFLKGKGIDSGIYTKNKDSDKYVKIIAGEVSQILVDENNIFVVATGTDRNIYSYSKDGKNKKQITKGKVVTYMIQENNAIYFSDEKSGGKLYRVYKFSGMETIITKEGAINIPNSKNYSDGGFCMGIYDGYIYYINTNKGSKLFKAKIDGTFDEKEVIGSSIEKISMIGYSVIYKEKDVKAIYRYEIKNSINSEVTSGRIIDFSVSIGVE